LFVQLTQYLRPTGPDFNQSITLKQGNRHGKNAAGFLNPPFVFVSRFRTLAFSTLLKVLRGKVLFTTFFKTSTRFDEFTGEGPAQRSCLVFR